MGEYVIVGDVEGYVHFLAKEDGAFAARIQIEDSPVMAQLVNMGNSTLLAQTRDGGLYVISTQPAAPAVSPSRKAAPPEKKNSDELKLPDFHD